MKNLIKISVLALAATALMVSCTRETNFEEQPTQKVVRTFTCTFAQPADTKIAVAEDGKTTWKVGDEIMIHGGTDGKLRQKVTLTADDISADGKKATISFEMDPYIHYNSSTGVQDVTSTFYAQYPASLVPEGSMYYEARFSGTNDFLMAACNVGDEFVFFNLCGIISYIVDGEFDNVEFVGNNQEAIGYSGVYQARVRDTGEGAVVTNPKFGNGSGDAVPSKVFKSSVELGEVNYIFLPAGAKFTGGFTFKFYDGQDLVKVAKTETAVEINPGQILALGDISGRLEDYVEPTSSDHKSAITNATDLSAQKANCYVITAPGAYKFPALKGSSEETAGNVFGVELVWESCNNAEEVAANSVIAAVDFEDNWMYFKTPETLKAGNAVIAAKDFNDKIIWSWHIWIPSTTIETNTYGLFNHELMDRNLGALVAAKAGEAAPVESFGLTYQWGRKDPFVGAASTTAGDNDNAAFAGTAPVLAAATISLGESIANPTLLGHTNSGDWLSAPDNTLWKNDVKTIYDPCPAGYKVVSRDKNQPLMNADITTVTGWNVDLANEIISIGDPAATFPIAGYRDDYGPDTYAKVGTRVAYWTSYASSDAIGYHLNWRPGDSTPSFKLGETGKSRGAYVRCMKLEEASGEQPQQPTHTDVTVTLDGNVSEWDAVESIAGGNAPFTWKYTSDANNVYFFYKITASKIKCNDTDFTYKWRRYIYIGFDTDNNAATGQTSGLPGGLTIVGCEANALVYPFRGTAPAADAYPEGVEGVNGVDEESWIKLADGTTTESKITAFGYRDGDYFYLEIGVPRAGIGSPAAGSKVNVQFSFSWDLSDTETIILK